VFDEGVITGLAIGIVAVVLDLTLGEPPNAYHPVAWIGRVIGFMDSKVKRTGRKARDRLSGVALALVPILLFTLGLTLILALLREWLGLLVWAAAAAIIFKFMFAMKSLQVHTYPVVEALQQDDLDQARRMVSMVVSRDTSKLDKGHLASCAVETVSENTVDSVFSPFLFFGLFGIFGAIFDRVSNTLDAMVGYLSPRHQDVGWFSAKLDDCVNFLGARMAIPFILLALAMMGKDWRNAWRTAKRDHGKTASPNKGWPMAAFAGGLGIRMEKIGHYTFGDGPLPENPKYIKETIKLMKGSALLFFFMVALPLFVFIGIQVQFIIEEFIVQLL